MASFTQRLEKLDRRFVFLVVWLAVSLPIFVRLDLPIGKSPEVQSFYESIEKLHAGDIVLFPADFDPGSVAELEPMMRAALTQLFRKDVKVICFTLWPTGPGIVEQILRDMGNKMGKTYGTDYVFLGFKEGREVIMVQIANSFRGVFPQDFSGKPVSDFPLMNEADKLTDTKLMVNISAGYPGTKEWVQQVRTRFSVPMLSGCTAVSTPEYYPYYQSGQLSGLLGGLAGAAEYEKLIGVEGSATLGMPPQSLGHVAIVAFILLGNVLFTINRRKS